MVYWQDTARRSKFHWACALFRFHNAEGERTHKREQKKRKHFHPCACSSACIYACIEDVRDVMIALDLAHVLASVVKIRLN